MSTRYTIRSLRTPAEIQAFLPRWIAFWAGHERPDLDQHPLRLMDVTRIHCQDLVVGVLFEGDQVVGVAPAIMADVACPFRWGYRTLGQWKLKRAEIPINHLGSGVEDDSGRSLLCAWLEVCASADALRFQNIPVDSSIFKLFRSNDRVLRNWWRCLLTPPEVRRLIQIQGSFEDYLNKFSGRQRRKFRHELKKMEDACGHELRVSIITTPAQVASFIAAAKSISSSSWQGKILNLLIEPNSRQYEELAGLAERGWLRCYLLSGGEQPLAFVIGRQAQGVFYYDQIAYDTQWNQWSPGKLLLLKIIEDLHGVGTFQWLDFRHGDAEYKRHFSNQGYAEAGILLVKASLRQALPFFLFRVLTWWTNNVRAGLNQLGIIEKLRTWRRRQRSQTVGAAD